MTRTDITQSVQAARRGLKRDVLALCQALDAGMLFLPLAKALRAQPGEYTATSAESIFLHMLAARDEARFGAAFTREAFLSQCGARMRWTTDGGPLCHARLQAKEALRILDALTRSGQVQGVVLNAMQPEELILQPQETSALLRGEAFPMPRYIGNLPVQKDERFLEGEPVKSPPPELLSVLDALLATEGLLGYRFRQIFNEERDLEPHLLLRIFTRLPERRHPELAGRINQAMKDKLPPPGYIDILFVPPS